MYKQRLMYLVIFALAAACVFLHCAEKNKGTTPGPKTVQMDGTLTFPDGSFIDYRDITVGFGEHAGSVDENGNFTIKGTEGIPGLAMAYSGDTIPVLMRIVADPQQDRTLDLDVRSTALALVFLNPFVCVSKQEYVSNVLAEIEALPEFSVVEQMLAERLDIDPEYLAYEDDEFATAVAATVLAYYDQYESPHRPDDHGDHNLTKRQTEPHSLAGGIQIEPAFGKAGFVLSYLGNNQFRMENRFGRYGYCDVEATSQNQARSFMLTPNGTMLDAIKTGVLWGPSKRDFPLTVTTADDTVNTKVFAYGFCSDPGNRWSNLTSEEKHKAHIAGVMTIVFEFGSHTFALVTNSRNAFNEATRGAGWSGEVSKAEEVAALLFDDAPFCAKVENLLEQGRYGDLAWEVSSKFMRRLTFNADYRELIADVFGIVIGQAALTKIAGMLKCPAFCAPLFSVMVGNRMTSVMKTYCGLNDGQFKTSFKIWQETQYEWGAIQGVVADKESGPGIVGAQVKLFGDDNNPQNPAHETVTEEGGIYSFENILVGAKTVTASKTGYKSNTVSVTVAKGLTATANIELEMAGAGVSGKIRNEILIKHNAPSTLFSGSVDVTAWEIGGQNRVHELWAVDGAFGTKLSEGRWWVVARHDDYHPDSVQVTVSSEGSSIIPRDLVLKPKPSMSVQVYADANGDGSYEDSYSIDFPKVGLERPALFDGGCMFGGNPMVTMGAIGVWGSSNSSYAAVGFGMNTALITQAGYFDLGGAEYFGCSGFNVNSTVVYSTTRHYCEYEPGVGDPIAFHFTSLPDMAGCNCGIKSPGTIYLTEYGAELTDVVAGVITASLPGYAGCTCYGDDTDGDGKIDQWDVKCAKVELRIEFRLLVGTDYLVTWQPSASSQKPSAGELGK